MVSRTNIKLGIKPILYLQMSNVHQDLCLCLILKPDISSSNPTLELHGGAGRSGVLRLEA